ncbi:hypothetical protein MN116_000078 [Schistosoma mekongi]|uniref:Leishmanolysin-like peptidase n=1 Tax=Schistosoma mekongi TaxID=38744 RepID=A0AAE1ZAW6_SCHME|nr:hypothetical protein MN116_000078 [Schistosoma mekongi]
MFCDSKNSRRCLDPENAVGYCYSINYEYVLLPSFPSVIAPNGQQYYLGPVINDYCVVLKAYTDENGHSSVCRFNRIFESSRASNILPEETGPNSTCFNYDFMIKDYASNFYFLTKTASCHRYKCSKLTGLQIIISGKTFNCPINGGLTFVELQNSTVLANITCPT